MACSSLDSPIASSSDSAPPGADPSASQAGHGSGRPQHTKSATTAKATTTAKARSAAATAKAVKALALDLAAVADVGGLEQEIAVLRASIRQLSSNGDMAPHVKVLAELRHQIEALCRTLRTQQSLAAHGDDERAAELARVLDELGDELGGSR